MRRSQVLFSMAIVVVGALGFAEASQHQASKQTTIGVINPNDVILKPAPINPAWVLEGNPQTMGAEIAHSDDGSTKAYVWQTTKSVFDWHYDFDEVVTILDGEVFLTDKTNMERRLGPGDVAFFPQGTVVHWRVPDHVKKVATIKTLLPEPIAGIVRWMRMARNMIKPSAAFASNND